MFTHAIPCGRRRTLDRNKKRLFCDAVAGGASMSEAAATLGVSLRTVQREARRDADFDCELRRAHHDTPDLKQLMSSHARSHSRATAWLLERQDPENYGRRSPSSCRPSQFEAALRTVVEAVLEVTELEQRAAVYAHVTAACEAAFQRVFPAYGPYGRRLSSPDPVTPLADVAALLHARDPHTMRHIYDRPEKPAADEPDALARARQPATVVEGFDGAHQPVTDHHQCSGALPLEGRDGEGVDADTSQDHPRQTLPLKAREPEVVAIGNAPAPLEAGATSQPPASPGDRVPSNQTTPQPDATPGRSPGLKDNIAPSFTPRLSYRYPLRTSATLNSLLPHETPPSSMVPEGPHDTSPAL